nr:erythromycin esterase family protein [uncultured Rhodococcus sp.]
MGRRTAGSDASGAAPAFRDRREAGRVLAGLLETYRGDPDVIVLGLARGGIPVAWEVASALGAPLDAFVVRKIGAPGREEFAVGALASGGRLVVNDDMVRDLRISAEQLREVVDREGRELIRREAVYRQGRPPADVSGRTVIVVDDGLATGASMFAVVDTLRTADPAKIVVAVPAAPESTYRELSAMVDEMVCATMPSPFLAVGQSFWDFSQVSDDEVRDLLSTPTTATKGTGNVAGGSGSAVDAIRAVALDAPSGVPSTEAILDLVGEANVVLIGESSHGTHEFYSARAEITKRLIEEAGFEAVAAEADWPDAYRVDRYVRGGGTDTSAEMSLRGFERFPGWMWRNTVMVEFTQWLRDRNDRIDDPRARTGFYGLDLYSLHRSMNQVVEYLDTVDRAAADRARERYGCFDLVSGEDGQSYGYAAAFGAGESCETQAVDQLVDLRASAAAYAHRDGQIAEDEQFHAERNASSVRDAEAYYRTMFGGRVSSWNLRDRHMVDTLDALITHLGRRKNAPAKVVVWAHNSHVGDARATEMGAHGELTVGQLVRELYGNRCRLIGLTTHDGTVTASSTWGGPAECKVVRPSLSTSIESLLHEAVGERGAFMIPTTVDGRVVDVVKPIRLERAIGVIYRPETERQSHYFHARVAEQFDAIIHIDKTTALEPLNRTSLWVEGQVPETYPSAL